MSQHAQNGNARTVLAYFLRIGIAKGFVVSTYVSTIWILVVAQSGMDSGL
jgi:hypothetical protein